VCGRAHVDMGHACMSVTSSEEAHLYTVQELLKNVDKMMGPPDRKAWPFLSSE